MGDSSSDSIPYVSEPIWFTKDNISFSIYYDYESISFILIFCFAQCSRSLLIFSDALGKFS